MNISFKDIKSLKVDTIEGDVLDKHTDNAYIHYFSITTDKVTEPLFKLRSSFDSTDIRFDELRTWIESQWRKAPVHNKKL